jgi:hypothetical protein
LSSSSSDDEFVAASDLESLQKLFSEYCDDEGLMSKSSIQRIPSILQLLVRCSRKIAYELFAVHVSLMKNYAIQLLRDMMLDSRSIPEMQKLLLC